MNPVLTSTLRALAVLAVVVVPWSRPAHATVSTASGQEDEELEELLAEFRDEVALMVRRGEWSEARRELLDLLGEDPEDWRTEAHLVALERAEGRFDAVRERLPRVLERGVAGEPDLLLAIEQGLDVAAELADGELLDALLGALESAGFTLAAEPRLAWPASVALLQRGDRERALDLRRTAADAPRDDWRSLLASARAERSLGRLVEGSRLVARAVEVAPFEEAELLAELGSMYFEAEGEGERRAGTQAPGPLLRDALDRDEHNESALLSLHALGKVNWRRQRVAASEYLGRLLEARPNSIRGNLAVARDELALGRLPQVRRALEKLERLAPAHRDVRALRATLAWVEHDRDAARAMLAELADEDPADSGAPRAVGSALIELYRFSEALEFLRDAVERDPGDHVAWTRLGQALANTGAVDEGLESLQTARDRAEGRRDVWRSNSRIVLERIERDFVEVDRGDLSFAWRPLGDAVLATYLIPFYREARRELALRYGHSPGPIRIEVFDRHEDFSVRSTGFQGFPALGVCFGPVVTAVSPISELRGSFSWARTSYHEFTHVIHLGISNNRCPRWITEGLATWEEERVNPAWGRNMRRDLLDARANGLVFPLRELNAAFRGPRIVFGYYQGGLLCEMLIAEHGFPSMIRLLEAFDRGADLDTACVEVFGATPEEIDARFAEFVDAELDGLALEPRIDPERAQALRFTLGTELPSDPERVEAWREGWLDVAVAAQSLGNRVDAEDALRRAESGEVVPLRALLLRGRMRFAEGDAVRALEVWEQFLERGGEDYFVRMALANDAAERLGELDLAEEHLRAAEAAFPGFPDQQASAELALARLFDSRDEQEAAMDARMRWLAYNADAGEMRIEVGQWLMEERRHEEAERYFREANEVDPFRGTLHRDWGEALWELERFEEASREFEVATLVPAELDADGEDAFGAGDRAELLVRAGRAALEAAQRERAVDLARRALDERSGFDDAEQLLEELGVSE